MSTKLLNKILFLSLIIFIIAIVFFIYYIYFKTEPKGGIKLNLVGPTEVSALEDYQYKIVVQNITNQKLTDIMLQISLPDGIFFNNKPEEKNLSLTIGNLEPQKSYEQILDLFFINSGNLKETLKININYKIENKDYTFNNEETFSVAVKNPPIKTQVFLPTKIYVNQEFQTIVRLINLTNKKLNNIKIQIEPPPGYILGSSLPKSENLYWELTELNQNETKDIILIGQIQDEKSPGIFTTKVDFSFKNFSFSLPKEIAKINVLENPVVFYVKSTPANQSIPIGSSLFYEVTLENKSQTTLENGEVKIIFDGPFDLHSLNTNGYFNEFDKALYWTTRNQPELLVIKPRSKIKFNFSVSLFKSYPILGDTNKNFIAKIRAEFRTPSIPVEVEAESKEYYVAQENIKKISGNISIEKNLIYNDPNFNSQGPFPLSNNQATTLAWHLKIKTIGEDFNNLTISTRFPIGVNFTGKVAGDAILDNVKYDPKTGAFLYSINKIPANLGYIDKEIDLVFQLIIEPPANTDLRSFLIIPEVQYSATGDFSQSQISGTIRETRSSEIIFQ